MTKNSSQTESKLHGRVAQILNERELVINIGEANGVKKGMKFAILSESPLEVVDPVTHEKLDVIDREKVRVEASEVRPKISICRTYRTRLIGGGMYPALPLGSINILKSVFESPRQVPETLKAEDSSLPPPLSPEEGYVKINDRVVSIIDE